MGLKILQHKIFFFFKCVDCANAVKLYTLGIAVIVLNQRIKISLYQTVKTKKNNGRIAVLFDSYQKAFIT